MAKISEDIRKKIKDKAIVFDEKAGTATITVTLYPKYRDESAVKLISDVARILIEEDGVQTGALAAANTINNKYGEVSGDWVFEVKGKKNIVKQEPVKKVNPVEKKIPVKREVPVEKKAPVQAPPKKEEPSSGFFAKRDKKKGKK